jgi:hypothetical protein
MTQVFFQLSLGLSQGSMIYTYGSKIGIGKDRKNTHQINIKEVTCFSFIKCMIMWVTFVNFFFLSSTHPKLWCSQNEKIVSVITNVDSQRTTIQVKVLY